MGHRRSSDCCHDQGRRSEYEADHENARLHRAYDQLPKTMHGSRLLERHPYMRPEWVMRVIEEPYDQWDEYDIYGRRTNVFTGRVEGFSQWIKVVLNENGALVSAFPDWRLERRFGGRPWQNDK